MFDQRAAMRTPLLIDDIDALLWPSPRADQISAWHGHVSFAHWIVQAMRPDRVVELGAHNGVSYAAFCNAVRRCGLPSKCFAIDTWMGDEHAGYYGEQVFQDLSRFNDRNYAAFSRLLRCRFDDALPQFDDNSIDLLHIDGLHTYEAVRHDFETWRPKLSARAVVLFHDTVMTHGDFGVWRLWEELSASYPNFSFRHASGLGVLAVGGSVPRAVASLCEVRSNYESEKLRKRLSDASDCAQRNGAAAIAGARQAALTEDREGRSNIALRQPAAQSSAYENSAPTPEGGANGIKNGRFGFHTDRELNPWWMVDLGRVRSFDEIVVYNRLDEPCSRRACSLVVLISSDGETWTEHYAHDGTEFGGLDGSPLRIESPSTLARFVRLKLRGMEFLHLDEVEIYSEGSDWIS